MGNKAREKPKVEAALVEAKEEQNRIYELQDQAIAEAAKEPNKGGAGLAHKGRPPKGAEWQGKQGEKRRHTLSLSLGKRENLHDAHDLCICIHPHTGRFFKLFSKKVNYPAGGWLTGVVRLYSRLTKQYLVVYDDKAKAPEWVDFTKMAVEEITKAEKEEFLRKPKALSMTRGHEFLMTDESKMDEEGDTR